MQTNEVKNCIIHYHRSANGALAEVERVATGGAGERSFTDKQKAVFRKRGEHRFKIPDGSRWGDVKAVLSEPKLALRETTL